MFTMSKVEDPLPPLVAIGSGSERSLDSTVVDLEIQKGGSATGAQSTPENFWVATPTSGHVNTFMTM